MVCIDFRNYHRNIVGHTVSAVVGNYGTFRFCICFLKRFDLVLFHINSAKDKVNLRGYLSNVLCCVLNRKGSNVFRNLAVKCPFFSNSILVALSGRSRACRNNLNIEPRMLSKEQNEPLTDHACGTDNSDIISFHKCTPQFL